MAGFRATAIARFVAACPDRAVAASAAASTASVAVSTAAAVTPDAAASDAASDAATAAAYAAAAAANSDATTAAVYAADAYAAAAYAAAVRRDAQLLLDERMTAPQLARAALRLDPYDVPSGRMVDSWSYLARKLRGFGEHWQVWIDWYDQMLHGLQPGRERSEAWEIAFTDVEAPLPWDDGAEAVNTAIAERLRRIAADEKTVADESGGAITDRGTILHRLTEIASPQPSLSGQDKLDAGPNPTYDVPTVDDDLPSLPLRQRNLIKVIESDLPANAPRHVAACLRGYDDELHVRGLRPILGVLKDMADIIGAAVQARRAEDEWLEPGLRQAFDLFAENHEKFLRHFPLDPKREETFARIAVDEDEATGDALLKPVEAVARASVEAHKAGSATEDFVLVVEKMTELMRVIASQPPAPPPAPPTPPPAAKPPSEIHLDPADRLEQVSVKKRSILSAIGFFKGAYDIAGSTASIATTPVGARIAEALRAAVEALGRFLP